MSAFRQLLNNAEDIPFSDSDIRTLLGRSVRIYSYEQLYGIQHVDEMFNVRKATGHLDDFLSDRQGDEHAILPIYGRGGKHSMTDQETSSSGEAFHPSGVPMAVVLYQFEGTEVGHWIALWKSKDKDTQEQILHHYDSMGFEPDHETGHKKYTQLLEQSGMRVDVNVFEHQRFKDHTNTCGRHACMRLMHHFLSHAKYDRMMKKHDKGNILSLRTPDDLVTAFTITHGYYQ